MAVYFLTVRLPRWLLYHSGSGGPFSAPYDSRPIAFYKVDLQPVADGLLHLFQQLFQRKRTPPLYKAVSGADLNPGERMLYRKEVELLEQIRSVGDWDPGTFPDAVSPGDRRTVLLARHHAQAQQWEHQVRKELRVRDRSEDLAPPGAQPGRQAPAGQLPSAGEQDRARPKANMKGQLSAGDGAVDEGRGAVKKLTSSHSDDFTSVIWFGTEYSFNKTQAAAVRMLWQNWERGTPNLAQETIGATISGADRFRLLDVFRMVDPGAKRRRKRSVSMHPAWGTMIVACGKGIYRLNEKR